MDKKEIVTGVVHKVPAFLVVLTFGARKASLERKVLGKEIF